MCSQQRIALYGGTFDPVHTGHLEIARRVSELFEIEKLLFIPAQMAPHKIGRPVTEPIHRYAMLALATQNDPKLSISTFELDAPDRRYTVDTIEHFQRLFGAASELFFIMGADSWAEITTWREWERLLKMTNHIVATRPGYEPSTAHVGAIRERVVDLRAGKGRLDQQGIFFTDVVMNDVSATNIRRLASEGRTEELRGLVPGPVLEYIRKYGIYRELNEAKLNS
ncbi:MAG TPA: nicotinate-nucleotide adenylyltransferase [Pyrinomonadaceae bacterium]|jgi:nicotinate-nucleotide adenylyltransferase|nr:nicotinate-nucleotide adenylyltransferase [Pyrinomonadaceae bacterium]